jgi:hypothetical protein
MAGNVGYASRILHALMPMRAFGRMMARQTEQKHFLDRSMPPTDGNLEDPRPPFAVEGGWRAGRGQGLEPDQQRLRRAAFATGAVGMALASLPAILMLAKRKRRRGTLAAVFG